MNKKLLICLLLFFLLGKMVYAQEHKSSWNYFEPGFQITSLLDGRAYFYEFEAGRQFTGGFSIGGAFHIMASDVEKRSLTQTETITSLWYGGINVQYTSEIRNRLSLYGRAITGVGFSNYHVRVPDYPEPFYNTTAPRHQFMMVLKPELGTQYRISDVVQINLGVNVLYGHIFEQNHYFTALPSIRTGLRLGK